MIWFALKQKRELEFTPLEFETFVVMSLFETDKPVEFTPLEFETPV